MRPITQSQTEEITRLLQAWSNGDKAALGRLMPLVYGELRRLAAHYLRRERPGHTLQTTALVHEAYLNIVNQTGANAQCRAQFYAIAANLMRQILIKYALRRKALKRGGGDLMVEDTLAVTRLPGVDLLALDQALEKLSQLDPRQERIVELRFFGGLSEEEIAVVVGVSPATVKRDWRSAKAMLHSELRRSGSD